MMRKIYMNSPKSLNPRLIEWKKSFRELLMWHLHQDEYITDMLMEVIANYISKVRKDAQLEMIETIGNKVLVDVQEGIDGNPEWYRAMDYVETQINRLKSELEELSTITSEEGEE